MKTRINLGGNKIGLKRWSEDTIKKGLTVVIAEDGNPETTKRDKMAVPEMIRNMSISIIET